MRCGQERLDLLVRWCQLIGLVPFRMERDAESGRFLRFSFSWRHPLTYWLILIEGGTIRSQSTDAELLVQVVGIVFAAITCLFIPETLVFRFSYFSKASRYLHEFDTLLEDHHVPACSTRKFTVIGIVSALILSITAGYANDKVAMGAGAQYALDIIVTIYNQLRLKTSYVLKDTINLADNIAASDKMTFDQHPKKYLTDVASVNEAFNVLCRAAVRLSSAFSILGAWIVVYLTTITVWDGFMLSSSLQSDEIENKISFFLHRFVGRKAFRIAIDLLALVIVCFSANLPGLQIKKLRQRLITLSHQQYSDRKTFQISTFLMQATEDRIQLSAAGMFNVGMHLIPSLLGAALTYLVILIQTTK